MSRQTDPGNSRPYPGESVEGRPSPGNQVTPHDAVFQKVFGNPENAASQLRAVLPPDLAARLDLGLLDRVPGTFIDEALRKRHADLLFTVPLDGRDAFVYILMEHQSSSDPLMPYRMLRYIVRVWDRFLEQNPGAHTLPAVIPLVVYNGRGKWSAPRRLQDLIDPAPGGTDAEYLPQFSFLLDDLAVIDPERLRDRDLTPDALATLVVLRIAPGNSRAPEDLRSWSGELDAVRRGPGGLETVMALLAYILFVSDASLSDLGDLAGSLGPDAKEAFMTTAEMLEARGAVRGRTEGEALGRAETLIEILEARFGPLPESVSRAVHEAPSEELKRWTPRAATAETLDEVFD